MKIIHTADWHLGHEFYQFERKAEHEHFFECLRRIVADERPDALIVSGDVYNTATPSNTTMKQFTDNMVLLHNTLPEMAIVVVAGNHDSCSRLESTTEIWKLANVHVVGGVQRDAETGLFITERHIIELPGKGYILAVPFVQRNNLTIFGQLQEEITRRNTSGLPVVMTAHLTITGAGLTGHDEGMMVGGIESEPLDAFGTGYDYLALGHIHHPQTLKGGRARYSGCPIQINFNERCRHSVSVVEVSHGAAPVISTREISQLMQFYTIPAQPKPFDEALAELAAFTPAEPGYLLFNLLVKDYAPATAETEVLQILADKPELKYCDIKISREHKKEQTAHQQLNVQEIKEMNPIEMAKNYYFETYGQQMDEPLTTLLTDIIDSMKAQQQTD